MASNNSTLDDGDGKSSDWIEIHNPTAAAIDLTGWHLTDDSATPDKWTFPDLSQSVLDRGEYLVVFASGQATETYVDPTGNLHTDFNLSAGGEYLALTDASNAVVYEFAPEFPPQHKDISYGSFTEEADEMTFVDEGASTRYLVPSAAVGGWETIDFDDALWSVGSTGLGYEASGSNYAPFIETSVPSGTTSIYSRQEFSITGSPSIISLTLDLRYEDGFVAYLDGVEVARGNAPASPAWDSTSTSSRPDSAAVTFQQFDLDDHINLLDEGTHVLAIQVLNSSSNSSDLLLEPKLTATAVPDGATVSLGYMTDPTPGATNGSGYLGLVADTQFSVDRGFFDAPFQVEITTATEGAEIRYTIDGSAPTATTGTVYGGAIDVSTTTNLRAAAFKLGFLATNVDTQTYLFLSDVLHQDGSGLPAYASWGHNGADWEIDQTLTGSDRLTTDDLKSVPSISLTLPWEDMFGAGGQGIYISGSGVPRGTSIEMINQDGTSAFQADASVQIQGGYSTGRWHCDKLSMQVKFKEAYGDSKLRYPIFGPDATDKFDTITLDAAFNYSWAWSNYNPNQTDQREEAKMIQDQYIANLQMATGGLAPHNQYVHLYINGLYWGMYNAHERPDEAFASTYLGGAKDDYDIIKHNKGNVINGTGANYRAMLDLLAEDLSDDTNFQNVANELDIDAFLDYMIVNFYVGNNDWSGHNWYASYNRVDPAGRWRFHSWDAERTLTKLSQNVTGYNQADTPTGIHQKLRANAEYRMMFADRLQEYFFNDGLLTPENAAAGYQKLMNDVDRVIVGESARWGDNRQARPFTRTDWLVTQNGLLDNYFPNRTNTVLGQLRSQNLFPNIDAPTFNQRGGNVASGFDLTLFASTGTIYYTLDGSDPRETGGSIGGTAIEYTQAAPVEITSAVTVRARTLSGGTWSALDGAAFTVEALADATNLRIAELHYNPAAPSAAEETAGFTDKDEFEFVELLNTSSQLIELQFVALSDAIDFTFDDSTLLGPGERAVVVENLAAFEFRYGTSIRVVGQWSGGLSNGGEALTLSDHAGQAIQSFTYQDGDDPGEEAWPTGPDGGGPSLVVIDTEGDYNDGANWKASSSIGGTPGAEEVPPIFVVGDYNTDGSVTEADYALWKATFGSTSDLRADGNDNGVVDLADFTVWRDHLGQAVAEVAAMADVVADSGSSVVARRIRTPRAPLSAQVISYASPSAVNASMVVPSMTLQVMPQPAKSTVRDVPTSVMKDASDPLGNVPVDLRHDRTVEHVWYGMKGTWDSHRRATRRTYKQVRGFERGTLHRSIHDLALMQWVRDEASGARQEITD